VAKAMLTVKASVKPSEIDGIGLFADEIIPAGTVVWKFDARFDWRFYEKDFESMSAIQQEFLRRYSYLSTVSGKYVFSTDDSRFSNHSQSKYNIVNSDCSCEELCSVASRDIEVGEELLEDYRTFDANDKVSNEAYLDS
jgi:uncharacterized protein